MVIVRSLKVLRSLIAEARNRGEKISFVPTLGALHNGHLSLVRVALKEGFCVVSVFVNPTQFNDKSDLDIYPRREAEDALQLGLVGCDLLFLPSVDQVYPNGQSFHVDVNLGGLDKVMEGANRPGHFKGVVQVVKRLLDMVDPNVLVMGLKDFQQFSIIGRMIDELKLGINLRGQDTYRELDGLAMSSRNIRLDETQRRNAPKIYETLLWAKTMKDQLKASNIEEMAIEKLEKIDGFRPEYFEIVDVKTLQRLGDIYTSQQNNGAIACVACWVGDVRLIDNILL